jgi:hypothetical protein
VSATLLAIGTRKGLFLATSRDDRQTWEIDGPHFVNNAVHAVAIDTRASPARLLVGAESGHWGPSVFRSDDLGSSWHEPSRAPLVFPPETGEALAKVWQLAPADGDEPDVVWAGVEPAALFRSADGGDHFDLVRALWDHPHRPDWEPGGGGKCLHTVVPNGDRVVVGISAAGVYRSTDAGRSWAASNTGIRADFQPGPPPEFGQCVHKIAADAVDPDRLYLQNHGGVYRSDDAGQTWRSVGEGLPADFGFAVVAHPHRANTAYVYPLVADYERVPPKGASRVYRTVDAGGTWEGLSDGLPDQHAYGTVLRDAMCTDNAQPAGVYFGNRNGEVWASRDEGERWALIAGHLPDVFVVRAATIT